MKYEVYGGDNIYMPLIWKGQANRSWFFVAFKFGKLLHVEIHASIWFKFIQLFI